MLHACHTKQDDAVLLVDIYKHISIL